MLGSLIYLSFLCLCAVFAVSACLDGGPPSSFQRNPSSGSQRRLRFLARAFRIVSPRLVCAPPVYRCASASPLPPPRPAAESIEASGKQRGLRSPSGAPHPGATQVIRPCARSRLASIRLPRFSCDFRTFVSRCRSTEESRLTRRCSSSCPRR